MNTHFDPSDPVIDPKPSSPAARTWYYRVLFGDWGLRADWGLSQTTVEGIPQW
jgi:hypothetical protein